MTGDLSRPRIDAARWLLLLSEEPEDTALQDRFDAWLDADPAHVKAWAHILHTDEAIRASATAVAPLPSQTMPRDRRSAGAWRHIPRPGRKSIAAVAAGLVAIMTAPSLLLHMQADHVTGAGGLRDIALPDGSHVELGPESAIAISYSEGHRNIRLLAGQAWFEVTPNPARPFRVTSGDVTATVLGTAFDVRSIGSRTSVEVEHGRVRVTDAKHDTNSAPILTAGQWIRFAPDGRTRIGQQQPGLIGTWRDGELVASESTISELIEELRPWYNGRILLLDPQIGQKRVSGFYDARNPVDALRTIVHPHGGSVTRVTPWLLIVSG